MNTNKLNLFIGAYLGYYTLEIQYRSWRLFIIVYYYYLQFVVIDFWHLSVTWI